MPITPKEYKLRKAPMLALAEANRIIGEKPKMKPPIFIPAESAAVVNLLQQILDKLGDIDKKLEKL